MEQVEKRSSEGLFSPGKSGGGFKRKQTEDPAGYLNSKTPQDEPYRRINEFYTCRLTLHESIVRRGAVKKSILKLARFDFFVFLCFLNNSYEEHLFILIVMNMNAWKPLSLWLCFMLLCPVVMKAQKKAQFARHEFSVSMGYNYFWGNIEGLTSSDPGYKNDFRNGFSWAGQYHFRHLSFLGYGMLYSGATAASSHDEGKDCVTHQYLAPEICFTAQINPRWDIRLGGGFGILFYNNDSRVFGIKRTIYETTLGGHLNLCSTWMLDKHWGLGFEVQCFEGGGIDTIHPHLRHEGYVVKLPVGNYLSTGRVNVNVRAVFRF